MAGQPADQFRHRDGAAHLTSKGMLIGRGGRAAAFTPVPDSTLGACQGNANAFARQRRYDAGLIAQPADARLRPSRPPALTHAASGVDVLCGTKRRSPFAHRGILVVRLSEAEGRPVFRGGAGTLAD